MKLQTLRRGTAAAAVLTMSITLAACGSDDEGSDNTGSSDETPSAPASDSAPAGGESSAAEPAGEFDVFGPACGDLPQGSEAGSLESMVSDPVATAAGTNPLLKTLVAAVGATELGETLNSAPALTVFAPYDPAFEEIQSTVDELLAGVPEAETPQTSPLAQILAHHVLDENDDPTAVVGEKTTLNGDKLTISGDPESGMTVSDGTVEAKVLCGNIPTDNATVYVIDKVLAGATLAE